MAWTQAVRLGAGHLYPLATFFSTFPGKTPPQWNRRANSKRRTVGSYAQRALCDMGLGCSLSCVCCISDYQRRNHPSPVLLPSASLLGSVYFTWIPFLHFFFCFSFSILSLVPKINPVLGDLWKNHLNMTLNLHKRFFCSAFQGLPCVVPLQFFGNSVIASRSENSSTVLLHP